MEHHNHDYVTHIELRVQLLDHFLPSNKNNINQKPRTRIWATQTLNQGYQTCFFQVMKANIINSQAFGIHECTHRIIRWKHMARQEIYLYIHLTYIFVFSNVSDVYIRRMLTFTNLNYKNVHINKFETHVYVVKCIWEHTLVCTAMLIYLHIHLTYIFVFSNVSDV